MRHTQMEIVCSVFDEFRNLQHIFQDQISGTYQQLVVV